MTDETAKLIFVLAGLCFGALAGTAAAKALLRVAKPQFV